MAIAIICIVMAMAALVSSSHPNKRYVVIDAGSTGSRINIFTFVPDTSLRIGWRMVQNVTYTKKPGLSRYADNPTLAVQSLGSLIRLAEETLPPAIQNRSELMVRATAGLRLLKPKQRRAILLAVNRYLRSLDFKLAPVPVKILSGLNEAAYAWLAVNYVVNRLEDYTETVGTMEMGGGSTQITFYPRDPDTIRNNPNVRRFSNLGGQAATMYARSYLKLGLRSGMFMNWQTTPYNTGAGVSSAPEYVSPCLHPSYRQRQSFGPVVIDVRGDVDVTARDRFERCYANARSYMQAASVDAAPEMANTNFIATTAFFGVIRANGLVPKLGGSVLLGSIETVARRICATLRGNDTRRLAPLQCTTLCHTLALLTEGYGMPSTKAVSFYKYIDGVKPVWALGCAIVELTGGEA